MGDRMGARVRTAAGAYRILAPASRRTDRSCEGRRGGARDEPRSGQGAPAPGGTRQGPMSRDAAGRYVIPYDVPDDRRRARIAPERIRHQQ